MLSLYTLKSANEASKYYQQGDYYTEGGKEGYRFWWGEGAKSLGLEGIVDGTVFKGLLEGYFPDGSMMIQRELHQHHRPGYDLTFSAPKSVSILALVLGNELILEAHREAVKGVLAHLEKNYAAYRSKKLQKIEIQNSGNYIVAAFEHHDSRSGDPQLHTHAVLMNMTEREDKAWRTIYGDNLYRDKLLIGMEYRSLLARKLLQLGFELRFEDKGLFEIKGIPETLLNLYSKRREEIVHWLNAHDEKGGLLSVRANFLTRAKKSKQVISESISRWVEALNTQGFSLAQLQMVVDEAKARGPQVLPDSYLLAQQSVEVAIAHLSERTSLFLIEEVIKAAKRMSVLPSSEGDFLKAIEEKIQNKTVCYVEGSKLTTPETLTLKEKIKASIEMSHNTVNQILFPWMVNFVMGEVSAPKREALKALLTHSDQQLLVVSSAKDTLIATLKTFKTIVENQGFFPRFLTQTQAGVLALKETLKTDRVNTIGGFLLACEMRAKNQKQILPRFLEKWNERIRSKEARDIWIINGNISAKEFQNLQVWSKRFHARVLLANTEHQNHALRTFLKEEGLATILIKESKTKIEPIPYSLLSSIETLEKDKAIIEVPIYQTRFEALVKYLGSHTRFVVLTQMEKLLVNEQLRISLKKEGILKAEAITLPILQPLGLTKAQRSQIPLYQLGDVIRFNVLVKSLGVEKDAYYQITDINLDKGIIHLLNAKSQKFSWSLEAFQDIEVYRTEKREVNIGEQLMWTRTIKNEKNPSFNKIKYQQVTVSGFHKKGITVKLNNGKEVQLNSTDFKEQHWDYGYVTLFNQNSISFKNKDTLALLLDSSRLDEKNIGDIETYLNNRREKITLFCDNLEKLKGIIKKNANRDASLFYHEIPYSRQDLLETKTIVTEPIFSRLAAQYLKICEQNLELLKSEDRNLTIRAYSSEFRAACYGVETVILYHSERDAVFTLEKLKEESRAVMGIHVSRRAFEGAINFAIQKEWITVIPIEGAQSSWVVSRHTLMMERLCIEKMKQGKNQLVPIIPIDSPLLRDASYHSRLTRGQRAAVSLILSSPDRFAVVQGIAGSGKTTALKEVNRLCCEANFKALVLANTASAKNQAKHSSQLEAMTTAQFLTRLEPLVMRDLEQAKKEYGHNQLIIVDEASLVATQEQFRLMNLVEKLGARLRLVGDFKQQGSIGAGRAFYDLLAYGIDKAVMDENVRLKDEKAITALKKVYAGDITGTLQVLKDTVVEIPHKKEALERLVQIYMAITLDKRKHVLIMTPLNEDRQFINNIIRDKMKEKKELLGPSLLTSVLLPEDRREVDKREVYSFKSSDVIRFNINQKRLGIKSGDYFTVVEVDKTHHRLTLESHSKERLYWAPKDLKKVSDIEIYKMTERELMKNDTIIFKRNQESLGIFNGDIATVLNIHKNHHIEVLLANGQSHILNLSEPQNQHLDYGYALTIFAAQGRDVPLVLAYGEGPKPYVKKTSELKIGDKVILNKEDCQEIQDYPGTSVVGEIVEVQKNDVFIRYQEKTYPITVIQNHEWGYFPPFEKRQPHELPLSTTQQGWLVQITRGDLVYVVVPHLEDFKKTLERHVTSKQSALNFIDPKHVKLNSAVERLVQNARGVGERLSAELNQNALTDKTNPHSYSSKHSKKENFIDIDTLNQTLESNLLGYVSQWLGNPTKKTAREARWGRKGSFCLTLQGSKIGYWKNYETGEGGRGLISLYMTVMGVEWKTALKELSTNCGLERSQVVVEASKKVVPEITDREKIKFARKLYYQGVPIPGTLAEKYLREVRGVSCSLPLDFRFILSTKHPDTKKQVPALLVPIRDKENKITGVSRIFLNSDGHKLKDTDRDTNGELQQVATKAHLGSIGEGAVIVQRGLMDMTVWIAEGIETALSVAEAVPNQTVMASISVNQFKKIHLGLEVQKVVICADRDEPGSNTYKALMSAIEKHLSQGKRVFIAIPEGTQKCDFNDLIKMGGITSVKAALDKRLEIRKDELIKMKEKGFFTMIDTRSSVKTQELITTLTP